MVKCSIGIVDRFLSSSKLADNPEALKESVKELKEVLSSYELTATHAKVRPPIFVELSSSFTL